MVQTDSYKRGFLPYALAAALIGIVGGFSAVLGPAFVQDIGIAYQNTTWTALAQAISTAACAPVLGKLGDVFGRKRTLLLGITVFTAGNILTAFASSLGVMLLARFIVGLGTAAIAPVVLSFILTEFPRERIAKGFALYMLISSASVILGPTFGGWIIQTSGWRPMVWLCVGISAVILLACVVTTRRETDHRRKLQDFDGLGAVFVILFFGLTLCVPSFLQNFGWRSAAFMGVAIAAVLCLICLIAVERKAAHPILPGSFIGRSAFVLSVVALFLTQGLMQANMTNTIVFVNYTQPSNTSISGYAISVMYLGMSLGAVLLGPMADKKEPKYVLLASLLLTGVGCALLLLFGEQTPVYLLMASLGILGFGLGGNGTIFMKVALSCIPAQQAGAGTGTYGLFRDLAAPFGVAVFVPLFTNQITNRIAGGEEQVASAVQAIHYLGITELLCVAAGLITVCLLPKIHHRGVKT